MKWSEKCLKCYYFKVIDINGEFVYYCEKFNNHIQDAFKQCRGDYCIPRSKTIFDELIEWYESLIRSCEVDKRKNILKLTTLIVLVVIVGVIIFLTLTYYETSPLLLVTVMCIYGFLVFYSLYDLFYDIWDDIRACKLVIRKYRIKIERLKNEVLKLRR